MKRLALLLGTATLALAFAAPVLAADPATTTGPYSTKKVDVALYVDTVTSTRGAVIQPRGCAQTNLFPHNSRVVFRMWAVDTATGSPITDLDVKYAYIKIPGQANLALSYGKHGKLDSSPWFWSLGWAVPADYPLGTVPFKVVVKTKTNKFGTFQQVSDPTSQMTVIP